MALRTSKVEDFLSQLTFVGSDVTSNIEFVPIEAKSVTPESYTLIVTSPTAGKQPKLHTNISTTDPAENLKPKLKTNIGATSEEKDLTWGKALDEVFTGGALNGSWGKWDDEEGGGWKGLLSKIRCSQSSGLPGI